MRADVATDLSASTLAFTSVVWPALSRLVRNGEFIPVEASTASGLARDFDVLAGIDAWQKLPDGMRGIACRVQSCRVPWDTFTIRYERDSGAETEYAKRLRAIQDREGGWLYPHLTIHGYVSDADGSLLSAAVVRTCDLFAFAAEHEHDASPETVYFRSNDRASRGDANKFLVCPWANLRRAGVKLAIAPRGYACRIG